MKIENKWKIKEESDKRRNTHLLAKRQPFQDPIHRIECNLIDFSGP